MSSASPSTAPRSSATAARYPHPAAVLELLKPITWFPPMWAFMCGVVSAGIAFEGRYLMILGGIVLAGPLVCAMSQAINDWHDRHVDAINEPERPIPSGRVPGQWGLYIAGVWTLLSLALASLFGFWVVVATLVGLVLAWAYSAPPLRLKENGWYGNAAVAICYEGLAWFTGAAIMVGGLPDWRIIVLAALYSAGAHGIMTLNDFKSISGDRQMGVRTIPVQIGADSAAKLASVVMALPQVVVIGLLLSWGLQVHAALVCGLLLAQLWLMKKYLMDEVNLLLHPKKIAAIYNGTGTTLYVLGMLVSAFGIGSLLSGGA
ncbi:chlorophyll synthase ChlG [Pseudahrensia aquimaris]|uniref:Chlorophyll synthase ChlG n=1 Tax=Pseudahrensia aquimaris TaxID=744461 RepID=A0ABW3FNV9_9HYPH